MAASGPVDGTVVTDGAGAILAGTGAGDGVAAVGDGAGEGGVSASAGVGEAGVGARGRRSGPGRATTTTRGFTRTIRRQPWHIPIQTNRNDLAGVSVVRRCWSLHDWNSRDAPLLAAVARSGIP